MWHQTRVKSDEKEISGECGEKPWLRVDASLRSVNLSGYALTMILTHVASVSVGFLTREKKRFSR